MRIRNAFLAFLLPLAFSLPAAYAQGPGQQTRTVTVWRGYSAQRGPAQLTVRTRGRWAPGRMGWIGGGMRGHGPAAGGMLLRLVNSPEMRQRLNITPEQAEKIRQQATDFLTG